MPRSLLLLLVGLWVSPAAQELSISVNVDLVVLQATVRDSKGAIAGGLQERDFAVYEDGVRQAIRNFGQEDFAITAGLVVDHSGSMRPKLKDVVTAARTFVRHSNPQDEMFVVNFNESVSMGLLPPPHFTNQQDELAAAIERTAADGQTALYDAVAEGLRQLRNGSRDKKVLLVVSDGADNASKIGLEEVTQLALRSNAAIYTIGVFSEDDPDRNPGVLRRLALPTGGETFIPDRTHDVASICRQIAGDIRRQYTIGYVSNRTASPGVLRRIRVTASAPGAGKLTVRTRSGYTSGGL